MKLWCAVLVAVLGFSTPVVAQTLVVTVAWDANTETDLAGYQVSYGTATGVYTSQVDVGNVTPVTFTLAVGSIYYFAVKAYNVQRQYSPFSVEVNTASGNSLRPPGTPIIRK
jgi:hypothetical protein